MTHTWQGICWGFWKGILLQGDIARESRGAQCLCPSSAGWQPEEAPFQASLSDFLCQKWERVLHNQTSV